jgi:hypothetical protein
VAQVGFARLVNIGGTNKFIKHMCVNPASRKIIADVATKALRSSPSSC